MEDGANQFDDKRPTPVPVCCGYLRVKVRYACNLCDPDYEFDIPDPYTRITARRSDGFYFSKKTRTIRATRNPTWDEWLEMGWVTGFEVQVWDDNVHTGTDKEISEPEFIEVSYGYHSYIRHWVSHCHNSSLYLDYELKPEFDESEYFLNPCQNESDCTSFFRSYRCLYRQGRLKFYARYGRNLPDEDKWPAGDSDPYMKFVAYDVCGQYYEKRTSTDHNDNDPEWYENIDFGTGQWKRFEVSVWDEDLWFDDRLSDTENWDLPCNNHISAYFVTHEAYKGYIKFDYVYT